MLHRLKPLTCVEANTCITIGTCISGRLRPPPRALLRMCRRFHTISICNILQGERSVQLQRVPCVSVSSEDTKSRLAENCLRPPRLVTAGAGIAQKPLSSTFGYNFCRAARARYMYVATLDGDSVYCLREVNSLPPARHPFVEPDNRNSTDATTAAIPGLFSGTWSEARIFTYTYAWRVARGACGVT